MDYFELADEELAAEIKEGNFIAFNELSNRYKSLIEYKVSLIEKKHSPAVDDYIQEGYLGLFFAAKSFNAAVGASFRTFASVCVQNRIISAKRKSESKRHSPLNSSLPIESAEVIKLSDNERPEEILELKESYLRWVKSFEEKLTPLERKVLFVYLSGMKRSEVAKKAGIELKSYDNALRRLRKKLK